MIQFLTQTLFCQTLGLCERNEYWKRASLFNGDYDTYNEAYYCLIDGKVYYHRWYGGGVLIPLPAEAVAITFMNESSYAKVMLEDGSEYLLLKLVGKATQPIELKVRFSMTDYFKSHGFLIREYVRSI